MPFFAFSSLAFLLFKQYWIKCLFSIFAKTLLITRQHSKLFILMLVDVIYADLRYKLAQRRYWRIPTEKKKLKLFSFLHTANSWRQHWSCVLLILIIVIVTVKIPKWYQEDTFSSVCCAPKKRQESETWKPNKNSSTFGEFPSLFCVFSLPKSLLLLPPEVARESKTWERSNVRQKVFEKKKSKGHLMSSDFAI